MRGLSMRWVNLAFLHWPVDAKTLRALLPPALELDTFAGTAWIGVVPFRMTAVRPAYTPGIPTARDFPELNVRTYVRGGGRAGVWFFSLDAASTLAVLAARVATGLPYYRADMRVAERDGVVDYSSRRTHAGAPAAEFQARYEPIGPEYRAGDGTLDHWLTNRLCLFTRHAGRLLRLDIDHAPWPLRPASATVGRNTMASALGIDLPNREPRVLFASRLDVQAGRPVPA